MDEAASTHGALFANVLNGLLDIATERRRGEDVGLVFVDGGAGGALLAAQEPPGHLALGTEAVLVVLQSKQK